MGSDVPPRLHVLFPGSSSNGPYNPSNARLRIAPARPRRGNTPFVWQVIHIDSVAAIRMRTACKHGARRNVEHTTNRWWRVVDGKAKAGSDSHVTSRIVAYDGAVVRCPRHQRHARCVVLSGVGVHMSKRHHVSGTWGCSKPNTVAGNV